MINDQFEINSCLQQLAQLLLIDQICKVPGKQNTQITKFYPSHKLSKQILKPPCNIGSYINPLYIALGQAKQQSKTQQEVVIECIQSSKQNPILQNLLWSVIQLPKLRYQQSEKIFQAKVQVENRTPKNETNRQKLNFQTPNTPGNGLKESKNPFCAVKTSDSQKLGINGSDYFKNNSGFQLLPTEHTNIDLQQSSNEEQKDIGFNMSTHKRFQDQIQQNKWRKEHELLSCILMKKNKVNYHSTFHGMLQNQSQNEAKQQKNFIRNYFDSAKNKVLENCNFNCCESMFHNDKETVTNPNLIRLAKQQKKQDLTKKKR